MKHEIEIRNAETSGGSLLGMRYVTHLPRRGDVLNDKFPSSSAVLWEVTQVVHHTATDQVVVLVKIR